LEAALVELLNAVLDRFNSEGLAFLWLNLNDDMCFRVVPGLGESALSTISSFTGASTATFDFEAKSAREIHLVGLSRLWLAITGSSKSP